MQMNNEQGSRDGQNHPLAFRMAIIAFIAQNVTIACLWGSFSLLLAPVESRLGVTREMSSLGAPIISIAVAVLAPIFGARLGRLSLRWTMFAGGALSVSGYLLLGLSNSLPLYFAAFGLFLGPGMCLCGMLLPATLVTRWFGTNRGKALGLVHIMILIVPVPFLTTWLLQNYGPHSPYFVFAAVTAATILPAALLVRNGPPTSAIDSQQPTTVKAQTSGMTTRSVLGSPRFWIVSIGSASVIAGSVALSTHLVPMAAQWGFAGNRAASLVSVLSGAGMIGSIIFGWLADRFGGLRTLALVGFDCAILWLVLLLQPPFFVVAVVIGLFGVHSAGTIPVMSMAMAEIFGRENFSRAFGLAHSVTLPFQILGVVGGSVAVTRTGTYAPLFIAMIVFFALIVPLVLGASRARWAGRSPA